MQKSIVFTFLGADKPGLVEQLATAVNNAGGNWLESKLAHMAGKFAGIVRVSVASDKVKALESGLQQLNSDSLTIIIDNGRNDTIALTLHGKLSVIGNDRCGIVQEITKALASHEINIQELQSKVSSAPMTGSPLFSAEISFEVSSQTNSEAVQAELDDIADNLDVDIKLEWFEG